MIKRIGSFLLCLAVLISMAVTVFATEEETEETQPSVEYTTVTIETLTEFLAFAENCILDTYSSALQVELQADLDLTGTDFTGIPVFGGIFHGNGHTIQGLSITCNGSHLGLFRYLTENAEVSDLHVAGTVAPQGSRSSVGGLVGKNSGRIENCTFNGTVTGNDYAGGLVGRNGVTGTVENCSVAGEVYGSHFVGGIAGMNSGVIRDCESAAMVNTTPAQNSVEISDITTESILGTESGNTATDIGGIAGNSSGVIRDCKNTGDVGYKHMGYNVGGIAGTQVGYITGCENTGNISGRKEVGGIAGQMEPQADVTYSEDALQMLKGQLDEMSGTVGSLGANAAAGGNRINSNINGLETHMENAGEAIESLIPSEDNPGFRDPDTIVAAQNTLTDSINGMERSLTGITSSVNGLVSGITGSISTLSAQINAMGKILQNAEEHLGGSLRDASDLDTPEMLTGKVENCTNQGAVLGDANVGGITGAMAAENDLDVLEDVEITGELSMNYEGELRCVVLACRNNGTVTAKKEKAGGIVGLMPMGLVKECINTGLLDSSAADYVGGIAGESAGFIRNSFARGSLSGKSFVGGIAGTAGVVTDCRSMMAVSASEKAGGVIGYAEETREVTGNYYLAVGKDMGGMDGISYDGMAQGLSQRNFLALEDLPDIFGRITVTFRFEDGTEETVTLSSGEELPEDRIPQIPEKEGYIAHWEGLENREILLDSLFTAQYLELPTVIQSSDGEILASGLFDMDAGITVKEAEETPALDNGQALLDTVAIEVSGVQKLDSLRLRLPKDADSDRIRIMVNIGGTWQELAHTIEKSYAVMEVPDADVQLALIREANFLWYYVAAGGILLAAVVITVSICRKKKKITQ